MSGFEVAGIVLGSVPLLISAMEHYKAGLDPVKAFIRYQDELNRALRDLSALHTSLAMTLKVLLKQVASQAEVVDMMANCRHDLWKSHELDESLRDLLQEAYNAYAHILGDIESHLISLASKLQGLDRWSGTSNELEAIIIANPPSSSTATLRPSYKFKNRLKFAMKKKRVVELVDNVNKRTADLDALIFKVERLRFEDALDNTRTSTKLPEIPNLCSIFCREARRMDCCGFDLDSRGRLRGVYEVMKPSFQISNHHFSLDELLFPSPKARMRPPLRDMDRYVLAITLASSFLQLHATPWLTTHWNRDDIFFLETIKENDFRVDVEHPFVLQTYVHHQQGPEGCRPEPYPESGLTQDDAMNLLTLARLLLEIKLNHKPEDIQGEDGDDDGLRNEARAAMNPLTLHRWIKQEKGNLPWAWKDAVLYCMSCSLDPDMDLRDLSRRQDILNGVVVPLLEELHYWQTGPPEDL
ncbi:hypothetical protein ACJ41O_010359 [Fusarium nematophilum]